TVSYFEWLKNLSHVRFGRLQKRYEERAHKGLLDALAKLHGDQPSDHEMPEFARGADEIDLVNSGLEETMAVAYREIVDRKTRLGNDIDMRTAAMVNAIDKVAVTYEELGIFP
ncbi:MAG: Glu/Leu/Phe/Val dehydrogenase, partial [Gemmatimonadetes bacterium]|nr:Glu/Leu/Phe/Val dehydrogenase [Gemmatimonadota bacterium]